MVAIAIAGGIALRLALIVVGGAPEQFEYDVLARNVVAGDGYVYKQLGTTYRSFYAGLGYEAVNVATDWLFPQRPKAMLVAQSLYAGILAWLVFQIARRFAADGLAVASCVLVLCHPALVYYDTRKLHPLGFDSLMMMAAVWMLLRLRDDPRARTAALAGVVFGLALFQRGSMALFFAGGIVWLLTVIRPRQRALRAAAVCTAGVLVVVLPWMARNYAIQGELMLESMTMQQFWKGNASYSNGSGYLANGQNVYEAAPARLVRDWQQRDEAGQFRLFRDEALAEIASDPARAAGLVVRKFVYFWTAPPNSGQQYPPLYFKAFLAYYAVVAVLAIAGIAAAYRKPALRPDLALVLIYFASVSIVHALMFVEMRHRWATEPLMLAFVPLGARAIWTRWVR
jgi:4-amino-4-deoxy-L-arabinose transferase-like glycosyltransferase